MMTVSLKQQKETQHLIPVFAKHQKDQGRQRNILRIISGDFNIRIIPKTHKTRNNMVGHKGRTFMIDYSVRNQQFHTKVSRYTLIC